MPRFVILYHQTPIGSEQGDHWDLMLEPPSGHKACGMLLTWSLSTQPPAIGQIMAAVRIADHRLNYLEYEGPLTNDRGSVRRKLSGIVDWQCSEGPLLNARLQTDLSDWSLTITESDDQRCWIEFSPWVERSEPSFP